MTEVFCRHESIIPLQSSVAHEAELPGLKVTALPVTTLLLHGVLISKYWANVALVLYC